MEVPIQELEKQFDQINFDHIIASKQDENIQSESESDSMSVDLEAVDVKQNLKNVDIQFHAPDFDRNSPFNDDLDMDSNKNIESLELQTQVVIHTANLNSEYDSNKTISQPLDFVSSQSVGELNTLVDGHLTVIKLSKLQNHTSLNEQVLNVLIILDGI